MSGIVGGINLRSSGLVNNSSASDGEVLTGTGAGLPAGFEEASASGWTLTSEQATTSGTSVTFGSIPSGTKAIVIMFDNVSSNSSGTFLRVRIGDAGGIELAAYVGGSGQMLLSANAAVTASDYWGVVGDGSVAATYYSGMLMLRLQDATNNIWVCHGGIGGHTGGHVSTSSGSKALSAELTQVQIHSHNTFDLGAISVQYMS